MKESQKAEPLGLISGDVGSGGEDMLSDGERKRDGGGTSQAVEGCVWGEDKSTEASRRISLRSLEGRGWWHGFSQMGTAPFPGRWGVDVLGRHLWPGAHVR